jgi:DNA-3-methyladenine glycosylase
MAPRTRRIRRRAFFARPADAVAPALLGDWLCILHAGGVRRFPITETEAYVGEHDLACHAARGRTARTQVMYGPPGHAYVYFVYGMHDMLNIVCAAEGDPQAVLVRAVAARGPRGGSAARTDGPGLLTRALGITVARHNATDLCRPPSREGDLWIEEGVAPSSVSLTPRIGVAYAGTWADAPLRFVAG